MSIAHLAFDDQQLARLAELLPVPPGRGVTADDIMEALERNKPNLAKGRDLALSASRNPFHRQYDPLAIDAERRRLLVRFENHS